jgi:Ca-activated chloride channel family protein
MAMRVLLSVFAALSLAATPSWASGARPGGLPANVSPGELKVLTLGGDRPERPLNLPLQHTEAHLQVSGFVTRATVTQRYTNPFDKPIEAVYVFPLPHDAAVDGMTMRVGDKTIRGLVKRREEARRIYEQAKASGQRAGLLEQERPNIFTQSLGNILPGDQILIEITYVDILDYRDEGAFELVFPMVVGPRYIPGEPAGRSGTGRVPDTDQVPDASRITPPVLKSGQRGGHDIALTVELDAAVPIQGVHSVSHAVDITERGPTSRTIKLHPSDTLPNKDFVLRCQVAGQAPEMAFITHHDPERGGFFTFIALPQKEVDDSATVARDLIFILDTSGSMRGFPLDKSKQAMDRLIAGMRPGDRFNVVRFAGDSGTLWPAPRPNTEDNVRAARAFVQSLRGAGGTEMRKGITAALAQPSEAGRMRIAFLLTDGYVGNEQGILHSIEQERRGARIFTLGVGSSVNRYLLDRAALVGRGEAFYLRQDEDATAVIERFFRRVDRPNLADLQIDWNGLAVRDLTPARIPDLWAGQPIRLYGRYAKGGSAEVTIRGLLGAKPYSRTLRVSLPENQPENAVLASVWARARVKELMLDLARGGDRQALERQVTELGLEYRIMTQWTSFVAVEEKVVNEGGEQRTVVQPVELPEGVDYEGVFGEADAAMPPPQAYRRSLSGATASAPLMGRLLGGAQETETLSEPMPHRPPVAPSDVTSGAPKAAEEAVAGCRWAALSVSGGLRYPLVVQRLKVAWPDLCRALKGRYAPGLRLKLALVLDPDGSVKRVEIEPAQAASTGLAEAIREAFGKLGFGPVAGGAPARVRLLLILT